MATTSIPKGDKAREAVDALKGYVYQIYQSALAWIELNPEEFLFLEVAEDYAVLAENALNAVQVKGTGHNVTINSDDIVASIDSFVELQQRNPELRVKLRHLTTSKITKEKSAKHRIGDTPALESWRKLAKTGDISPLRKILNASKLSKKTKDYIYELNDKELREKFLKRIHFDCGALDSKYLRLQVRAKLSKLIIDRGGVNSQVDNCLNSILVTLLHKATQKEERFVDRNMLEEFVEKATHIPVNRAQLEVQNQLIIKALSATVSQDTNLIAARISKPSAINEVPLPKVVANRTDYINNVASSLDQFGFSWIYGAAGVGKTVGAKIVAQRIGGNWVSINVRGLNSDQVNVVLSGAVDSLTEQSINGFLVDDFECSFEPHIIDKLLFLKAMCNNADILLVFTSSREPSTDFLYSANLLSSIGIKFEEFSEQDIREILVGLGMDSSNWAKYIHIISGGGHPQLAIAAIQSMQDNNWDINELKTLNSLIVGNTAIDQVRSRTRERLLNDLPESARRLLERLSLKIGSFRKSFVLDMAQIEPLVSDGGIIFDRLIGSWVDQQERDRFALSPLLTNFAINTLTDEEKRNIHFEIANSLIKERTLNPIDANSALLAAWTGKNKQVIALLCKAVFSTDHNELEMISTYLMMFTFMKTDSFAYEDDPVVSQMARGAQLVLVCHEEKSKNDVQKVIDMFEVESERVQDEVMRASMNILVYSKVLLSRPKFGALPNFWELVRKLNNVLENQDNIHSPKVRWEETPQEIDGRSVVGFMFVNQVQQLKLINELLCVFEFLDTCAQKFRDKLLKSYDNPDFPRDCPKPS